MKWLSLIWALMLFSCLGPPPGQVQKEKPKEPESQPKPDEENPYKALMGSGPLQPLYNQLLTGDKNVFKDLEVLYEESSFPIFEPYVTPQKDKMPIYIRIHIQRNKKVSVQVITLGESNQSKFFSGSVPSNFMNELLYLMIQEGFWESADQSGMLSKCHLMVFFHGTQPFITSLRHPKYWVKFLPVRKKMGELVENITKGSVLLPAN